MKKLNLLLLEDNDDEANELIATLQNNGYVVNRANNIRKLQNIIERESFDFIILDIMIDGKPDGIAFAQKLNEEGIDIPFIFLTSINDKSVFEEAKYTKPFHYLLKPYNELELLYALELAIEKHYSQLNTITGNTDKVVISPDYIFVSKNNKVEKIEISSIHYIKVEEKYCTIISDKGDYLVKLSLKKTKTILPDCTFKQVHRNYLVNIKKIKEIYFKDNLIVLENNNTINFSERYKSKFIKENPFII
ncbi:response regulator transcription factor [uncultured Algibacter sp.]|uniref:LytR/AlgR family response regulator transcription factor n=1 Tax=uncultured Algibacter sp. TaxID=298659 RepID=UPI003218096B